MSTTDAARVPAPTFPDPTPGFEASTPGSRILAFVVDLKILVLWGSVLFAAALVAPGIVERWPRHPAWSQIIGFCVLTVPFWLYLMRTEGGRRHATLGKLLPGLRVHATGGASVSFARAGLRNALKLLPWEIAQIVPHQLLAVGETTTASSVAGWVAGGLGLVYVVGLFTPSGRPLYDRIAGTLVLRRIQDDAADAA